MVVRPHHPRLQPFGLHRKVPPQIFKMGRGEFVADDPVVPRNRARVRLFAARLDRKRAADVRCHLGEVGGFAVSLRARP